MELIVALCCFVGMLLLVLVGLPLFLSLFITALIGFWLIGGPTFALAQFTTGPYYITSNYMFAVVPLFVVMGVMAGESGLAEGAYNMAIKWIGQIRGGIAIATIGAAAVFGACCAETLASVAVFTKVALPSLDSYKYDRRISLGCIACSGGLALLIPPSVGIVIVAILTEISIGKLLVAGIIPGIVLAIALMSGVFVLGIIYPRAIPKTDVKVSWKERFLSLGPVWPVMCLFVLVMGGIYMGIFPPTSGAAIGAFGVFLYALWRRKGMRSLFGCFRETVLINAQIFLLLVAGYMYSRLIVVSGTVSALLSAIQAAQISPIEVMGIFTLLLLILGCVIDPISMLIITVPVFSPIMTTLGFDGIAFGIITVILVNIATLTPPIGMACFVAAGVAKVDPMEVFKGVTPFFFISLIVLWFLILFPRIVTWLPNLFY